MANHYISPEGLLYANVAFYLAEKQCEGRILGLNPCQEASLYYWDPHDLEGNEFIISDGTFYRDKRAYYAKLYGYNQKDVEVTMSMYNAVNDADAEVRAQLADAKKQMLIDKKLELVAQYGEDTYANSTLLQFDKKFTKDGLVYTYAALKTNNTWYVTGERGLFGFTKGSWDELVLALVGGEFPVSAEEVAIASSVTPLLDSDASYNNDDERDTYDNRN
jgi:hypothetical protein